MYEPPWVAIDRVIELAFEEDLASGDPTSEACIDADAHAVAHAGAREPLVVCGGPIFARVFAKLDPSIVVETHAPDGGRADSGRRLWSVRGRARPILAAERVVLNLVQRMCGVATLTRAYVDAVPRGRAVRITDTRKTIPGLRALERYAVRVGGGHNHRDNLGVGVLIKDNHIAACGGVGRAIERARAAAPHTAKIECEIDSLAQLDEALAVGVDIVLLDNMSLPTLVEAVARVRRAARVPLIEVSGGVTLDRVGSIAETGVDVISVGALTHSARAVDVGLDFE